MLAFIYLAYQMMALLFETVPSFTDTWIECLGDLARYRMAIEEEKEAHATWGGVAARWYTMASDRHPAIGRLYHHLGILERPSLRKLCFYAKSLTGVIPFPNARDSLSTLCGPIVQDEHTIQSSRQSAEARIVTFHALNYTGREISTIESVGKDSLSLLSQQPVKLRDFGPYFAVTNIAAIFELGSPSNNLWQYYNAAINQTVQGTRPASATADSSPHSPLMDIVPDENMAPSLKITTAYFFDSFEFVVQNYSSAEVLKDCLSFVHVSLVWFHSLHFLRIHLQHHHTYESPFDLGGLSWSAVAAFLNLVIELGHINAHILECARQGLFPSPERKEDARPLSEDYIIRGLIWGQFYFCPEWFDNQSEDDGRAIESPSMVRSRAERVTWLGLFMAFHTEYLSFDLSMQKFSAASSGQLSALKITSSAHPAAVGVAAPDSKHGSEAVSLTPRSRSSRTISSGGSYSDEGFHVVQSKKATTARSPQRQSYAHVASCRDTTGPSQNRSKKPRQDADNVCVADENDMVWTANSVSGF